MLLPEENIPIASTSWWINKKSEWLTDTLLLCCCFPTPITFPIDNHSEVEKKLPLKKKGIQLYVIIMWRVGFPPFSHVIFFANSSTSSTFAPPFASKNWKMKDKKILRNYLYYTSDAVFLRVWRIISQNKKRKECLGEHEVRGFDVRSVDRCVTNTTTITNKTSNVLLKSCNLFDRF